MNTINTGDKTVKLDGEGYLENFNDWDENVALELAKLEEIAMTDDHWVVIRLLREHFSKHEAIPTARDLAHWMGDKLGEEKGSGKYLARLFPNEPPKQSAKIAGLPRMPGCT